jgi:hypothetical protein
VRNVSDAVSDGRYSLHMEVDGSINVYNGNDDLEWSSDTAGLQFEGADLLLMDNGSLCLWKHKQCLWESGGMNVCRPKSLLKFNTAKGTDNLLPQFFQFLREIFF